MTCTYEVVSVYVCPYCSHDNETIGPCARCGLAGNPSKTPWGIKDNRHTKYWHKYNWQAQQDFDNYQERANSRNHNTIMSAIRPKGKLKDARFLRAGRPATMDFRGGISNRDEEAEQEQPPAGGGPGNQAGQPAGGQPAGGPEEPEAQIPREENQPRPEAEYEGGEQFVPLRGLPNFRFVVRPGSKFPVEFYHIKEHRRPDYGYEPDPEKRFPKGPRKYLPRGICLVELPNGMRIPFYSSSGSNAKPGVDPSDWLPLMGIGYKSPETPDGYWFNKLNLPDTRDPDKGGNEYEDCWEVKELQQVREWLTKNWPGSRIIKMVRHAKEGPTDEAKIFYSQMFIEKYPPLPSPNNSPGPKHYEQYNKVLEDLQKGIKPPEKSPEPKKKEAKMEKSPEPKKALTQLEYSGKPMFGTYNLPSDERTEALVELAIRYRYQHFNLSDNYGNEHMIAPILNRHTDVGFVVYTKIDPKEISNRDGLPLAQKQPVAEAVQYAMDQYADHITVGVALHWPGNFSRGAPKTDKIKLYREFANACVFHNVAHEGVSNFNVEHLKMYHEAAGHYPDYNEIEFNPIHADWETIKFCQKNNIRVIGFSTMGHGTIDHEPKTDLIRWAATHLARINHKSFANAINDVVITSQKHIVDNILMPGTKPMTKEELTALQNKYQGKYQGWGNKESGTSGSSPSTHHIYANPSPQMSNTTTPVQMRPRATHDYQPTGYAYTKPELLIALDIDDTLVDTSQRMRSAKRMGLFDPKQVGKKQHPKGREAFREFFYSSDRFSLDKPIRGAVDFAHAMLKEGYKIAYITGRPDTTLELTKSQLRNLGFPLSNDKYGATLVYCKPATAKETAAWKKNILSSLQSTYDVRFFFDNNPKNLEAGRQLGIPGLYLAIDQYTGITALADRFKKAPAHLDNPSHVDVSSYRRAAGCIVQRATDKKVLLLRRSPKETSMHGLYELPGGKLEEGETPKQTAKIETKEEAGMDVKIVKELTPVHVDHDMKKCYHCFLARPKKNAKVVLSEEHDAYKWVTPEEALTMSEPLSHHAEHFFRLMTGMKVNPVPLSEDEEELAYRELFDESPWANPPGIVPIMTGEPTGKHTKLGTIFAEVFIGRNIGADVGEVVQAIYRGVVGGRTTMAEKRMAMAVASMQKELSDKATELGGNAVANLRVDYEMVQGAASVTLIAHGDAIKTSTVRNNPGGGVATKLYREFNGKAPDKIEKTSIKIPTTLVRVGEGGCWSVGYRSDKEGHGEKQKYIHEFGDFGRFPKKKPKKGHRKEPDLYAALDEKGNVIDLRIIGGTFSLDVDPDTGINWLVG